jgi:hypothetical protein
LFFRSIAGVAHIAQQPKPFLVSFFPIIENFLITRPERASRKYSGTRTGPYAYDPEKNNIPSNNTGARFGDCPMLDDVPGRGTRRSVSHSRAPVAWSNAIARGPFLSP